VSKSSDFKPAEFDITAGQPLKIGFGQTDYFRGRMADVRLYNDALSASKIGKLVSQTKATLR
jgi:hypothetical protein